jgi:hypothetical protein
LWGVFICGCIRHRDGEAISAPGQHIYKEKRTKLMDREISNFIQVTTLIIALGFLGIAVAIGAIAVVDLLRLARL